MTETKTAVEELDAPAQPKDAKTEPDLQAKLKEVIDVQVEPAGTLRKKLTISIPRSIIDERLNEQYSELKRDAVVPGFRKGRAPLVLVEKRFGNEVGDQLTSQLVGSGYMAAVDKVEIKALGDPLVWVTTPPDGDGKSTEKLLPVDEALEHLKLPGEGAFSFACEVDIRPEFELPPLDAISVEKPIVSVSEHDVNTEIERLRGVRGRYVPTADPVQEDDLVVADYQMTVAGQVVADQKNVSVSARSSQLEGVLLEDLGTVLKGKTAGDSARTIGQVPNDHNNLDWRGQSAEFSLVIQDVKRLEIPPFDEALLSLFGFESEQELREHFRARLESGLGMVIRNGMRGQIGKFLLENTRMDLPPGVSQRQTDRLVARRMVDLLRDGTPQADIEKQMDELRARASEEAMTELKLFFIMEKIAEKMELDISDEEMNGAIAGIAARQERRFDRVRDELAKGGGLTALYLQLRDDKILDILLTKANIKEIEPPTRVRR